MMQPHRWLVARTLDPQEHKPTESGRPPTAPHLLISGAPRPRPSQSRGMGKWEAEARHLGFCHGL